MGQLRRRLVEEGLEKPPGDAGYRIRTEDVTLEKCGDDWMAVIRSQIVDDVSRYGFLTSVAEASDSQKPGPACGSRRPRRPLCVVGVAEQGLFWKDLRRVVFSGASFRVLVRMGRTVLRDIWTPVKLAHGFEPAASDLARLLSTFGPKIVAAMPEGSVE